MRDEKTLREYLADRDYSGYEDAGRPVIEFWPDEWAEWVSRHRKNRADEYYCKSGTRASVFCPYGIHE